MEKRLEFRSKNLLNHIRKTIVNGLDFIPKDADGNPPDYLSDFFVPHEDFEDRYGKIDAHSVFAVAFYYSAKNAIENKEHILASIALYYSMFHLSFALIALNFSIPDQKLEKIRHSELKNVLKNLVTLKVIDDDYIFLYEDLQEVREYLNYINVPTGYLKFMSLRRGHVFTSKYFSEDIYIGSFCIKSLEQVHKIISNYYILLHDIEESIVSKKRTKGVRPELFKAIRRVTLFDWYGEDFLNNSFNSEVRENTEKFLARNDIYPDENFFDDL